ncbi:hypothetical protein [Halopiger thermotolerans]
MTRKTDSTSTSTSTSSSSSLRSDAGGSAARTDQFERRGAVDASDGDDETADGPLELAAAADQCRTCDATIGPRERRLSWVVETETATLEAHYCSETCLPDEPPTAIGSRSSAEQSDSQRAPRDWSYCR